MLKKDATKLQGLCITSPTIFSTNKVQLNFGVLWSILSLLLSFPLWFFLFVCFLCFLLDFGVCYNVVSFNFSFDQQVWQCLPQRRVCVLSILWCLVVLLYQIQFGACGVDFRRTLDEILMVTRTCRFFMKYLVRWFVIYSWKDLWKSNSFL